MEGSLSTTQSRFLARVFDTPLFHQRPLGPLYRELVLDAYLNNSGEDEGEYPNGLPEEIVQTVKYALETGKKWAELESDDVTPGEVVAMVPRPRFFREGAVVEDV